MSPREVDRSPLRIIAKSQPDLSDICFKEPESLHLVLVYNDLIVSEG